MRGESAEARVKTRSRVVIIALLLAVAGGAGIYPSVARAQNQGYLCGCLTNLNNIATGLEMYSSDYDGEYPRSLAQLTPDYLVCLPRCPSAGSNCYRLTVGAGAPLNPDRSRDYYLVECMGANHRAVSVTGDYPAYNGVHGLIERAP